MPAQAAGFLRLADGEFPVDDAAKYRWIAGQILPHEGAVRGWLARHVRTLSGADIDDLVQEAYARLWSSDLPVIDNGRAYFFATVRNLVFEQARRARIVPMERMGEIQSLRIISEEPGPERQVGARQELERLRRIVDRLSPQCRRAFELRKFDGLSIRETAEKMGITQSTVEKHLTKALALILSALGEASHERGSERGVGEGSRTDPATPHERDSQDD